MSTAPLSRRQTLALMAAAGLVPLDHAWAQGAPKSGGTLTIGITQVARHLNGAVQSGSATGMPSTQLFASPIRFDGQWKPQPYLAETWKLSPDGKSLTLNLRKNAVFHDGKPVTSEDVAFSVMAIKANHPFQPMFAPVEKVDTPDKHTAVIRMSTPHPAIVLSMSPALCPILPKHVYGDGQDLKSHPRNVKDVVGSGPFKLVEFNPGNTIVLQRFDAFFLPNRPLLDRVIFKVNTSLASQLLELERGSVQMIPLLSSPVDLKRLKDSPNLQITAKGYDGLGPVNWLAFNMGRKPFDDVRVRHALAHTIDKNFVAKALMSGFAVPVDGPLFPTNPLATTDLARYPLDLKKAEALLDAAGLKKNASGERMALTIDYLPGFDDQQKVIAEYLRAQFKKVGVNATVRTSADFPAWSTRIAARDYDVTMDGLFTWGDPVIGVHRSYLSSNIKPIVWTNTHDYRNPAVDELLKKAGEEPDPVKRKQLYAQVSKQITTDLPVEYITTMSMHTAATKAVHNLPETIWGPLSPYDEMWLG